VPVATDFPTEACFSYVYKGIICSRFAVIAGCFLLFPAVFARCYFAVIAPV
jgi:hypothetical protein